MLRCFNYMEVIQQPSDKYPSRNKTISLDYLNKYEAATGWEAMTDGAKIVFPKNIIATNLQGETLSETPLYGTTVDIGNGDSPLFLKGDKISISAGYWYYDQFDIEQQYVKLLFEGFITVVHSKLDITLECQDCMYILKQCPVPDKVWGNKSLQELVKEWIKGSPAEKAGITVSTFSESKFTYDVGTLKTSNETIAQVLARLRRESSMVSYMKGTELRLWYPIYRPEDVHDELKPYVFDFQKNVISDNLQYQRKDDLTLSAIATNLWTEETGKFTKDGKAKTKKKRWVVYVYSDKKTQTIKSKVIKDRSEIPVNTEGQRFDLKYTDCPSVEELIKRATATLQQKYYTGLKGDITTFGMPFISFGDNIKLLNRVLPDINGTYKVKAVNYFGGIGIGIRQQIFIDYRIDV